MRLLFFFVLLCFSFFIVADLGTGHSNHVLPPFNQLELRNPRERPIPYLSKGPGCEICWEMLKNLMTQLDVYMTIRKKNFVPTYVVEDFLEHICDPHATSGWWTRKFRYYVFPQDPELKDANLSDMSVKVNFSYGIAEDEPISKCSLSCYSVKDTCQYFVEYVEHAASLPSEVSELSKDPGPLFTPEHFDTLNQSFCMAFVDCYARNTLKESVIQALNSVNVSKRENPRKFYLQEKIVPAEESSYTKEFFPYNQLENPEDTKLLTDFIFSQIYELRDKATRKNQTQEKNL